MLKIITSAALITKAIASIQNRGGKLDTDIHAAGVSVLKHAAEHGDTTLADKLVQAMPKGGRKLALVEWMLAYGAIALLDAKNDKDAIAAGRLFKLQKAKQYDEAGAIAESWTEFRKEAAVLTAFDAQAAVASVLARFKKASEGKLENKGKAEALAQARALVAALEG